MCGGEWDTTIIKFNQSTEIDENTLGSLGTQVALLSASWANLCIKHQVKGHGLGKCIARIRVFDIHISNDLINLFCIKVLNVCFKSQKTLSFIGLLAFSQLLTNKLLNQLISTPWGARFRVFYHEIFEFVHMTRSFKNFTQHETGATDLKHVFFEHIVLSPELLNVVFDGATERTIVKETGDTVINLERWHGEEFALA